MKFFDQNSQGVKSALFLFSVGQYTDITDVPNLFNLREEVQKALDNLK